MTTGNESDYLELTLRLRAVESFCEFLVGGGRVRIADTEGGPFNDVTSVLLERRRKEAEALRRTRMQLFPERSDQDAQSTLYSHH
jgi:hypothetical protein